MYESADMMMIIVICICLHMIIFIQFRYYCPNGASEFNSYIVGLKIKPA